jgi:hypothetical protein
VEQHCWPCTCRDTVLIGNVPTPVMAASRQAARDHMVCLEPVTRPLVLATQVQRAYACAQPDSRRSSAEWKRDPAAKRLSEALLPQPHQRAYRFPDNALLLVPVDHTGMQLTGSQGDKIVIRCQQEAPWQRLTALDQTCQAMPPRGPWCSRYYARPALAQSPA